MLSEQSRAGAEQKPSFVSSTEVSLHLVQGLAHGGYATNRPHVAAWTAALLLPSSVSSGRLVPLSLPQFPLCKVRVTATVLRLQVIVRLVKCSIVPGTGQELLTKLLIIVVPIFLLLVPGVRAGLAFLGADTEGTAGGLRGQRASLQPEAASA